MQSVLLIAYHFPPLAGSSGVQRTLRFAQHLPSFGWRPLVLSAHPRAYERVSDDLLKDLPADLIVERAFALDTARQLSLFGRYPGFLARPDRWMTWRFDAVRRGMQLIEQFKPVAIWSTYPIATAHEIGAVLQKRSRLPWIADFRDPMAQDEYPADLRIRQSFIDIEKRVFSAASAAVFTTPGSARMYSERFPESDTQIEVIENGYDEESFKGLGDISKSEALNPGKRTLLHSGIIYPWERDPRPFFDALATLRQEERFDSSQLVVRLRAAVHEDFLRTEIAKRNLGDIVELAPPIPYREALREMMRADALLVMQASNCNEQIPAKVYEYLRCGRPILGLTDPVGNTAAVLNRSGISAIAPLDQPDAIAAAVENLLRNLSRSTADVPKPEAVRAASRQGRTRDLANLLAAVVATRR